jgi:competence protein ComEA
MPTPTERRALTFFAGVILLGAAARVLGASGDAAPPPDAGSRLELHHQIAAVDSARRSGAGKRTRRRKTDADTAGPRPVAGGSVWTEESTPPRVYYARVRPRRSAGRASADSSVDALAPSGVVPPVRVDIDVASAAEIEGLPRIGPTLARRIVADRDANGPFGSLDELTRVKGIGPAIARTIAPYVTFTLTPRPSNERDGASGDAGGRGRRLRKPRSP